MDRRSKRQEQAKVLRGAKSEYLGSLGSLGDSAVTGNIFILNIRLLL